MKTGAITTYLLSMVATGAGVGEAATATSQSNITWGLIIGGSGVILGFARLFVDRHNTKRALAQRDRELDIMESNNKKPSV
jgi:hypothetical protein